MYSSAGESDAELLMRITWTNRKARYDCDALAPQFMDNLIEFASLDPYNKGRPPFRLPAAWEFIGGD